MGSQFTHNLSPLDVLEKQSRQLADELTTTRNNNNHSINGQPKKIVVDSSFEWTPERASIISRASSVSSTNGGGILDSFRLSTLQTLAGVGNEDEDIPDDNDSDTDTINGESNLVYADSQALAPDTSHTTKPIPFLAAESNYSDASMYTTQTRLSNPQSRHSVQYPPANAQLQLQQRPLSVSSTSSYVTAKQPNSQYFFPTNRSDPTASSNAGLKVPPSWRSNSINKPNNSKYRDNNYHNNSSNKNDSNNSLNTSPALSSASTFPSNAVSDKLFGEMTMEEHVLTGIQLHENGNLRESSYHWQYAAFKGDSTAMLLYGLALRHGWGIRKNATEAVKWLKNAMENSLQQNGNNNNNNNISTEPGNRTSTISSLSSLENNKSLKKAHIGLALYELGMSYLHSWGIEKDDEMALKSFEMAGDLGDTDALCEAAALFMKNGPKGRKKDLQKAARLYRRAGELGASMVGNSWIYKDKYMDKIKK